jgi:hypothetical protein
VSVALAIAGCHSADDTATGAAPDASAATPAKSRSAMSPASLPTPGSDVVSAEPADAPGEVWPIEPVTREIDEVVLELGVADVAASKWFYAGRGFAVEESHGRKYVAFGPPSSRSSCRS